MDITKAKKIAIIGIPGSGKTFLAKRIGKRLGIPVFHMDMHFNTPEAQGTIEKRIPIILKGIQDETKKNRWIIDGNYPSHEQAMELRLKLADLVLYLNFPLEYYIKNIKRRGHADKDAMNGFETEESVMSVIQEVKDYAPKNEKTKLQIQKFASDKYIEFNSREQVNEFMRLNNI